MRTVAAAAGPCWIKLVQWAATRPDLFSHSITTVLSRLHSNSPEHSFTYTQCTRARQATMLVAIRRSAFLTFESDWCSR